MTKTIADFFPNATTDREAPVSASDAALLQDLANDFSDQYLALCEKANNLADLFAFEQARAAAAAVYAQAPGMYRNPETGAIYRVKMNQAGTNMYAYVLRGSSWEYIGGLARNDVREAFRMTLEECDAYSVHIGHCCLCGRGLTNIKSVGLGMGPVCRKRQANRGN